MRAVRMRAGSALCCTVSALLSCSPKTPDSPSSSWKPPDVTLEHLSPTVKAQISQAIEAAARQEHDPRAVGQLGMTLDAYGLAAAAARCYERARMLDPGSFRWPYHQALVNEQQGLQEAAVAAMREAVRLNPEYLPAQIKLGELYLAAGLGSESLQAFQSLVQSHADLAQAHYGLARALSETGESERAAAAYERACALFRAYGPAHYAAGLLYRRLGREREARRHLAEYEKNPDGVPALPDPERSAIAELNAGGADDVRRGVELEAAGHLHEAVAAHEKALSGNPRGEQAHVNLISLYGRLGDAGKVEKHYRALVALNPHSAPGHYNYGVYLFQRGRLRAAEDAFDKALKANPLHAEAHHNYGFLLEQQGRHDAAERHYRAAVERKPDYRLARFHLGRILVNRKQYEQAIREFNSILEPRDAETPGYIYALAIAYGRSGRRREAITYARQAREQAAALGQSDLIRSIDAALKTLEGR